MTHATFALLTDFGTGDGYVAAMKGVILRLVPGADIIDISHDADPHDVSHGATLLADVAPYLPLETVCVAVVDPGVGTTRRPLIAATARNRLRFVGPDNGILWPAMSADSHRIHVIENPGYMLPTVASTFHGRDVFAPAAAHLALGAPLERFGPPVTDPVHHPIPSPHRDARAVFGQVIRIDRFGNLISNIRQTDLPARDPASFRFRIGDLVLEGLTVSYGHVARDALLVTVGGFGRLELAVNQGSAAARLGVNAAMSMPFSVEWS